MDVDTGFIRIVREVFLYSPRCTFMMTANRLVVVGYFLWETTGKQQQLGDLGGTVAAP